MEEEDSDYDFFSCHPQPVCLHTFIAAWMALMAYNSSFYDTWIVWWLYASYAILASIAAIFRMGWFIPCTILGIMSGLFFRPEIEGTRISQNLDVVVFVLCGTILGVGTGLAIDLSLPANSPGQSNSSESD